MTYKKIAFIVLLLLLAYLVRHPIRIYGNAALRSSIILIAYPWMRIAYSIGRPLSHWLERRTNLHHLQAQLEDVQQKNNELQATIVSLRSSLNFHELTSDLISYQQRFSNEQALLCQVIGRTLNSTLQVLVINRGSYHGVQQDMVAVWYNNVIGRVYEVHPYCSHILLITDRRCNVPVWSLQSKASGLSHGNNDNQYLTLDYVEHSNDLANGMAIYTSGQGLIFPQGFAVGTLTDCHKELLYYKARITLPYEIKAIEHCYLIAKGTIEK